MEDKIIPNTLHFDLEIHDELILNLFVTEYENAIHLSIYDNNIKMGSYSVAYPGMLDRIVIFTGKNEAFATAITQIISKQVNKITYGSVYIENDSSINLTHIKQLIDKYLENKNKSI